MPGAPIVKKITFQKMLDIFSKWVYYKDVPRERTTKRGCPRFQVLKPAKNLQNFFKKVLTSRSKCGIIKVSKGKGNAIT